MAKSRALLRRAVLITLVLTVLGAAAPGAPAGAAPPSQTLSRPERGQAAIDAIGNRLPAVAAAHGTTAAELRQMLLSDETLWVSTTLRLYYVEPRLESVGPADGAPTVEEAAPFPLADTFWLHSRPGSQRVIFLDFDGHTVTGSGWNDNSSFGTGATIEADPYDKDGLPGFSDAEKEAIQDTWRRVVEDYAPFDVDVTTQDPGYAAISRSGVGDPNYGTRVVVDGGAPDLTCSCGGVAYVGVFAMTGADHDYYQPAWVFQGSLGGVNAPSKSLAEAATHEVGHNLGLSHDGRAGPPETYYQGHGAWAPIMGVGYYRPITQWSKGEYDRANQTQDDLAVIAANGLPPMGDDHGDVNAAATALVGSPPRVSAQGLISTRTDVDVFSFTVLGGQLVTVDVDPVEVSPNLDVSLELVDAGGSPVAGADVASAFSTSDVATGLNARIQQALPAGSYYARVDGVGQGTASTGYTDYASLGQYEISVTVGVCALEDPGEEDDSSAAARLLVAGQAASGTRCADNDDWVRVPGVNGTTLTAGLSAADDALELDLFDATGSMLSSAAAAVGSPANLIWPITTNADHFLRISGDDSAESRYDLTTALASCPADDRWENDDFINQTTALPVPGVKDGISCSGDTNNADHAQVTLVAGVEATIRLTYPQSAGTLGLYLFRWDEVGTSVASGAQGADEQTITYTPVVTDQYQIRVDRLSGSVPYHLVVSQGAPVNQPPTVTLTAPVEGASVKGMAPLAATAADDVGVAGVTFYVDGLQVGVDTTGGDGWTADWDTAALAVGSSHTVTATAVDGLGQQSFDSSTVSVVGHTPVADFDGDGDSDIAVFRPAAGTWYADSGLASGYGADGDVPVPGDYDGDATTDTAIFRPSTGLWAIHSSNGGADTLLTYGVGSDIPVPGDYDGDGRTDIGIYRPTTASLASGGTWYVRNSATNTDTIVTFGGVLGDIPVVGDYDGDGKADLAIFRPASGGWFVRQSSNGAVTSSGYGASGDIPVPGDYDGDGRTDTAIFRPSAGLWAMRHSSTDTDVLLTYGVASDQVVPADYDGDGRTDVGLFRSSLSTWFARHSASDTDAIVTFGLASDIPVALPHAIRRNFY